MVKRYPVSPKSAIKKINKTAEKTKIVNKVKPMRGGYRI